jgi:hypothetical protein
VKDWKRSTLVAANRDAVELETPRGRVTEANPLRQARDYAFELVALMQQDPTLVRADGPFQGKLLFPYGWGVVFSHLRQADLADTAWGDFAQVFPPHQTLLRDDLDESVNPGDFFNRLWGLFTVHYPHTLTLPQRDRIRWHLFPEIRVHLQEGLDFGGDAAAAAPQAPLLPDLMQVMDLQQEQIARTLGEGHRVIHGVAGSGKTMILIYRAQQLAAAARPDQPILVLCFNRALADRIDAPLRQRGVDERVQVRTFHSWCQDLVNSYQLYVPDARPRRPLPPAGRHGGEIHRNRLHPRRPVHGPADRRGPRLRRGLAAPGHPHGQPQHAEPAGAVRRRPVDLPEEAPPVQPGQRGHPGPGPDQHPQAQLPQHRRDPGPGQHLRPVAAATERGGGDDPEALPLVQPASAGRRGPMPVLISAQDPAEEAQLLAERIAALVAEGVP